MEWRCTLQRLAPAVAALGSVHGSAHAEAYLSAKNHEAIRRCADFMLTGPSYNGIEIRGDKFNCNKMFYRMQGATISSARSSVSEHWETTRSPSASRSTRTEE
jgi:hypothetical protein